MPWYFTHSAPESDSIPTPKTRRFPHSHTISTTQANANLQLLLYQSRHPHRLKKPRPSGGGGGKGCLGGASKTNSSCFISPGSCTTYFTFLLWCKGGSEIGGYRPNPFISVSP